MKTIFLLIIVLSFNSSVLFSQDNPPDWKLKLPSRLYINEICIRPAKEGCPNWIELWNHTDKAINMKNWSIETAKTSFEIKNDFIVEKGKIALILFYEGDNKNEEFEKTIPENCKIIRFFNKKTFPYKYVSENVMEREREEIGNKVILCDSAKNVINGIFWGNWNIKNYLDDYKIAEKSHAEAMLSNMLGSKMLIYPGCTMLLDSVDRFTLLSYGTSTPGSFYTKTVPKPVVAPSSKRPSFPSYYYFADPRDSKDGPTGMGSKAGNLYLSVKRAGINLDVDRKNGWDKILYEITYDKKFKYPVLKSPPELWFNWNEFYFFKQFTFEDYLYLIGKTLYCRVARVNKDGQMLWSEPKSLMIPNLKIPSPLFDGLLLGDILKTKNEINYHGDLSKVKKIASLIKKLKNIVNTLGSMDLMKINGEGRLRYMKFDENLDGMWLSFYLYGIKCLPCSKSREKDAKQLKKVNDFSFLKGISNLGLDFSGTDLSEVGGLRLILEKLPEKPTGLRLVACNLPSISALTKLSLTELDISRNKSVCDLTPLSGMPLKKLNIQSIGTVDISPLVDCKDLEEIILSPKKCINLEKLKEISTLQFINKQPVKKFFQQTLK